MARLGIDADPFITAVPRGITRDLDVAMANKCFRAAILLIYAGIDAMGYTTLPPGREEVTRADFIDWAEKYIHFPGPEQLSGLELFAARCAVLHTYGVESKLSRSGVCRKIGYFDGQNVPPIMLDRALEPDWVFVTFTALRDAFFQGIDDYANEASADPARWAQIEARLHNFLQDLDP